MIHDPDEDPPEDKTEAPIDIILRVGEERNVKAAARSQSGTILESVTATVMMAIHKDENDAITLEDGVLTAVGAGSAVVRAESAVAGISGDINVTVTKPIDKIAFMVSDPAAALDGPVVLAVGQKHDEEITAVAQDEDGKVIMPRSNWSWDPGTVATVEQKKDADDALVMMGAIVTITGKSAGDGEVTATAEGVSGSIDVSVTGQTKTAFIRASTSNNGNTFVWDRGKDTDTNTAGIQAAWNNANTQFQVFLYDIVSNERIIGAVSVASNKTDVAAVGGSDVSSGAVNTTLAGAAAPTVEITPVPADPDATGSVAEASSRTAVVTLTATGADPIRILFTVNIVDAPE